MVVVGPDHSILKGSSMICSFLQWLVDLFGKHWWPNLFAQYSYLSNKQVYLFIIFKEKNPSYMQIFI